jgi:hypothetical protein
MRRLRVFSTRTRAGEPTKRGLVFLSAPRDQALAKALAPALQPASCQGEHRDTATSVKVAIVNQAFARKILKSADPLGKRFRIHESPGKPRPLYEIVGVTADNKFQDMHEEFLPFMYFPSTQEEKPSPDDHILIRSLLPLNSLIASMKETIANANPGVDLEFLVFKTRIQDSLLQDE